jgi:hypothetical protein
MDVPLENALKALRNKYPFQDSKLWDLSLQEGEGFIGFTTRRNRLSFSIHGFRVDIFATDEDNRIKRFSVYVQFPEKYTCFIHEWLFTLHSVREKDLQNFTIAYETRVREEFTFRKTQSWDARRFFNTSREYCGLEQVMDAARHFIQSVILKENRIGCKKAKQRLAVFEEELLAKSCHPRRMSQWLFNDFDPFAE